MKNHTILLFILFSFGINSYAQVDFEVNIALGISTPQIFKESPNYYESNNGMLSPIYGINSRVKWKNFVFETGLESSQTKIKAEYKDDITNAKYFEIERVTVNRFSIPICIGYNFKNIRITPMIGFNKIISNYVNSSLTTINNQSNISIVITESTPYTYYLNDVHKYEFLARIDLNLTDRLCLGASVIFRKAELQKRYFGSSFFGYYEIDDEKSYKRDCRVLASYRL